jgi:hypothetical protein
MWEGTTSRVMVADRSYDKFYDFYSVSVYNFGSTLVCIHLPRFSLKMALKSKNMYLKAVNS